MLPSRDNDGPKQVTLQPSTHKPEGLDSALFSAANDLVVNTAHAWGIGLTPQELAKLQLLAQRLLR